VEPQEPVVIDVKERQQLFGNAKLGLLYSGNFGRAHFAEPIPRLSRQLSQYEGKIAFSIKEREVPKLKAQMEKANTSILFAPFASAANLESRLSAADVHIVSLRESWTGTVVPSKFFGALAIGRPVLFLGSRDSAVAKWNVVRRLGSLAGDEDAKNRLFHHCHAVYHENFSRRGALDRWDQILRSLVIESKRSDQCLTHYLTKAGTKALYTFVLPSVKLRFFLNPKFWLLPTIVGSQR
jgi:hypothetical protein